MIDLHSHTDQSDGTFSPPALINEARRVGVRTLAITDHDTFAGYEQALPFASDADVELICGIELSTKFHGKAVHLLGYFFAEHIKQEAFSTFQGWIAEVQASRQERNVRLAARLRELGFEVTLEEAQSRGRGMTGRPHFARILMEKGYVSSIQEAFDRYLGESGAGYVERDEPTFRDGAEHIRNAGGIASMAHPIRFHGDFEGALPELRQQGLNALEAYHSDHSPEDTQLFLRLAKGQEMLVTGGSDFHGTVKPGIALGTGHNGNLHIPEDLVVRLRQEITAGMR